jgi:hypothetical protein
MNINVIERTGGVGKYFEYRPVSRSRLPTHNRPRDLQLAEPYAARSTADEKARHEGRGCTGK